MPSTLLTPVSQAACALALFSLFASTATAQLNAMTAKGCYSSSSGLTDQGSYTYQTSGYCQPICVGKQNAVLALSNGSDCWCGDTLPPANTLVDDSKCNTPCNGYGQEMCGGGTSYFTVWLTGTTNDVSNFGSSGGSDSSSSSGASQASSAAPVTTPAPSSSAPRPSQVVTSVLPGTTVIVTMPAAQSTGDPSTPTVSAKSSGSTNVAGIAAGVVVGVVAVAAICIGAFFFIRRRKRQAAEDEYKRTNQVNDFMHGNGHERKPPNTGYSQMSDQRLDTEAAAGRRNSVGSIADDQDYSRRILRVANPDSS